MKHRYSIRKRNGKWRVYDHNNWAYTCDTLTQAHTEATQDAIAQHLYQPGALTLLTQMRHAHQTIQRVTQR